MGATCARPARPREIDRVRFYNGGEPNFEEIVNLQIDLLAQAMACDVTRFGTLQMWDLSRGGAAPAGLPELPDDNHSDLAHVYDAPRVSHYNDGGAPGSPETWRALGKLNRWHYGKCARLLQRLEEFGILDETLVVMTSDMGDPAAHSSRNIPVLLAGGAGGAFRMGRRVHLAPDCPPERAWCAGDDRTVIPNNHLLTSIAQAFGVETDSFAGVSGALTEIHS